MFQFFTPMSKLLLFIASLCLFSFIMLLAKKSSASGKNFSRTGAALAICTASLCLVAVQGALANTPEFFIASATLCVLFFHSCTDYTDGLTLDLVTYIFVPCLLALRLCFGVGFFLQGMYGALTALAVMLAIYLASRGRSGAGDVFVATCLGSGTFSIAGCALCLYLAFAIGAVTALTLLLTGKITRQTKIPFAPFLFLGYAMGTLLMCKFWDYVYLIFPIN